MQEEQILEALNKPWHASAVGKVVRERQYFADPFEAPAWRSQWVQRIA